MEEPQVAYTHEDRQWDIRINVPTDDYLQIITENIMLEHAEKGKFQYILISGVEVGTQPRHSDFGKRHVHIAVIFHNRASKASIIKNWGIIEGNGYYMVSRNRGLPYAGWRAHHTKELTKVDTNALIIFEAGELPKDKRKIERSESEKKETTDVILKKMRVLLEEDKDEEAFTLYPRNYLMYGEKLKSILKQKKPIGTRIHPHIWLYGNAGTGKTAIMNFLYPNTYKKDLNNRFFDLYDDKIHDHIMLEDVDYQTIDKLGVQFLKTICDESGFPIDQKYKTPQLTKSTILVTSQFDINTLTNAMIDKGCEETKVALHRRFLEIPIYQMMQLLGLNLIPPYERKQLKKAGNDNPKAIFMTWDWIRKCPTGEEVKEAEHYQNIILKKYYSM